MQKKSPARFLLPRRPRHPCRGVFATAYREGGGRASADCGYKVQHRGTVVGALLLDEHGIGFHGSSHRSRLLRLGVFVLPFCVTASAVLERDITHKRPVSFCWGIGTTWPQLAVAYGQPPKEPGGKIQPISEPRKDEARSVINSEAISEDVSIRRPGSLSISILHRFPRLRSAVTGALFTADERISYHIVSLDSFARSR